MLRISRVFLLVGLVAVAFAGCIFSPKTEDPTPPRNEYAELTAPESLIVNLQVSYRRKDIPRYAELLATDFVFKFQEIDQTQNGDAWTRDQDSTGTDALFRTPLVSTINIDLTHLPAEDPSELGFDDDVKKVRINFVQLEVEQTDGTTLLVTDLQDMYFRPGRELLGEDPERWYLLEWRDFPDAGGAAPRVSPLGAGVGMTTAEDGSTRHVSWGALRSGFAEAN